MKRLCDLESGKGQNHIQTHDSSIYCWDTRNCVLYLCFFSSVITLLWTVIPQVQMQIMHRGIKCRFFHSKYYMSFCYPNEEAVFALQRRKRSHLHSSGVLIRWLWCCSKCSKGTNTKKIKNSRLVDFHFSLVEGLTLLSLPFTSTR